LRGRFAAFLEGLGVTAVLQSSTAAGLMVSSFAAGGLVGLVPALAVMLGANVGTTLIVQLLSFDIGHIAPLFVLVGVILFRRSFASRTRDLGRVAIGLGLMLLALQQLLSLLTPYEDVPSLRLLMGAIATQPIIDVIIAAAMTWAAHSSVAMVLLTMSLAAQGVVPPHAAFALVLGANLGSALNPLLEGATGSDPAAKRVPAGNLLNRLVGVVLGLALLNWIGPWMVTIEPMPGGSLPISTRRSILSWQQYFCRCSNLSPGCWYGCCRRARCRPTHQSRSTWMTRHARLRPSPWPGRRARRCAWPMCSKQCSTAPLRQSTKATANALVRQRASTMCSTASIVRSRST
jgi:Na/Pi-cotransporter